MNREIFEIFNQAFDEKSDETQLEIAEKFWRRLGDLNSLDMAVDSIAMAKTLGINPAGDCMENAKENNFAIDQIHDAALYASRDFIKQRNL